MYRTKAGLRLRAIGDHPQAAQTVGINVSLYRYVAVTFCGMLCGLAGGYLSIVQSNLFVKEMVAGRGFMHWRNDSRWVESFGGSVRKPCICICTGIEN